MGHSEAEISKHVRWYQIILVSLVILTVVTVLASYLKLGIALGIVLALFIASVKGSLVGAVFMHLMEEQKLIYWIMAVTSLFFVVMIVLILGHASNAPHYDLGYETYLTPQGVKPAHIDHHGDAHGGHTEGQGGDTH